MPQTAIKSSTVELNTELTQFIDQYSALFPNKVICALDITSLQLSPPGFNVLYASPNFQDLYEVSYSQISSPTQMIPVEEMDDAFKKINSVLNGKAINIQHSHPINLLSGKTKYVCVQAGLVSNSNKILLATIDEEGQETFFNKKNAQITTNLSTILNKYLLTFNLEGSLTDLLNLLSQYMPHAAPYIMGYNEDVQTLSHVASSNSITSELKAFLKCVPISEPPTLCGYAVKSKQKHLVSNIEKELSCKETKRILQGLKIQACNATPILSKDNVVVGTLSLAFNTPYKITKEENSLLDVFIPYIGMILNHHAQRSLAENNRALLQTYLIVIPGMVYQFQITEDGVPSFLYCSDFCEQLYGYTADEICNNVNLLFDVHASDKLEILNMSIAESAKDLTPFYWEDECILSNGEKKWLNCQSIPQRMTDGSTVWTGVIVDRTQSRDLELNTQQQAKELTLLIDTANAPIFGIDTHGYITEWNKKMSEITHLYPLTAADPIRLIDYLTTDQTDEVEKILELALTGTETSSYELTISTQNNGAITLLINATTRRNIEGEIVGVIGVGQDITQRKQLEADLNESDMRWKSLYDHQELSIVEINTDYIITSCNEVLPAFKDVLTPNMVTGMPLSNYFDSEELLNTYLPYYESAFNGTYSEYSRELNVGNITRMVQHQIIPFKQKGSENISSIMAITTDITDTYNLKKNIEEIQNKKEQADVENRFKSNFIRTMSHELRTPLNSLILLSDLLHKEPKKFDSNTAQFHATMHHSATDLLRLIEDTLDLTKIESGTQTLACDTIHIKQFTDTIYHAFTETAKQSNLELSLTLSKDLPDVFKSDAAKVRQILGNIITNAINYTHKGSVTIHVCNGKNDHIIFNVIDTGPGIAKEKQHTIFQPFKQLLNKNERKGSGLGLSICLALTKVLGGKFVLTKSSASGSTFTFSVPISPATAVAINPSSSLASSSPFSSSSNIGSSDEYSRTY